MNSSKDKTYQQADDQKGYWKQKWQKLRHYIVYDILHANDTPHRLALGVAIGMFVAFTPTIPFQMALTFALSWAFRANKVVGLPVVWITNPATIVPIYFPMYAFGCFLLGRSPRDVDFTLLINNQDDFMLYLKQVWKLLVIVFDPLWLGSILIASFLGILSYYVTKSAIIRYRLRHYGSLVPPD